MEGQPKLYLLHNWTRKVKISFIQGLKIISIKIRTMISKQILSKIILGYRTEALKSKRELNKKKIKLCKRFM